jgi:hypothetical protein
VARTAAGSTLPAGGVRTERTDAHGGSVRGNSIRVMGLGAPHGLNGLFPFFEEKVCRGGGVWGSPSLSLQPPPGGRKKKISPETPCTPCVRPKPMPRKGFRRTDPRASPSAPRAGPVPAPNRPRWAPPARPNAVPGAPLGTSLDAGGGGHHSPPAPPGPEPTRPPVPSLIQPLWIH